MKKKPVPMKPAKTCPCGFTTIWKRAWHLHHKNIDCEYYAQVLQDRAIKVRQEQEECAKQVKDFLIVERATWIHKTIREMDEYSNPNEYLLGCIYDLVLEKIENNA